MLNPTSSPLTLLTAECAGGRGAGIPEGAPGGRLTAAPVPVGGRAAGAAVAGADEPAVGGRGAPGAAGDAVAPGEEGADGTDGPPEGSVGSLMVGDDVGLGGRLMRTVSFFGCTFEASGGLGGTEPPGVMGLLSAIVVAYWGEARIGPGRCQILTLPGNENRPELTTHPARFEKCESD